MKVGQYKDKEQVKWKYTFFDSVGVFTRFVSQQMGRLNPNNKAVLENIHRSCLSRIEKGSDWFGAPPPKDIGELAQHKYFLGMSRLAILQPKIKAMLADYLSKIKEQQLVRPSLAYRSSAMGMFSFDRAAMGLYTLPLSLSPPVHKTVSQLQVALDSLPIGTHCKEVYAYFKNKKSTYPALKLYVVAGANAKIDGDGLLYVGLACNELVQYMEGIGVAVEVNVVLGTRFANKIAMGVIRVKRFQDPLDTNQLLLLSSDPRYFRYNGFKGLIALSNYYGWDIPYDLGRIDKNLGENFINQIDRGGVVFEQSYSIAAAVKEVTRHITLYSQKINQN